MDPIELMSIKPLQIKQALGKDRVKVIRGSRHVYNARQARIRRGHEAESEDDDQQLETVPIWTCTDLACGGVLQPRLGPHKVTRDDTSQTDHVDMTYYWGTEEELKLHNITVVTARARDIQPRTTRPLARKASNISIEHRGSLSSIVSQTNKKIQKKSKATKYFLQVKKAFKDLFVKEQPPSDATTSDEEIPQHEPEERDNEWLDYTESERSQDDMQADFEQSMKDKPPQRIRTELPCHNLMSSITPFFWLMKLGGRWPLETYIEDRLVKFRFRKLSLNFAIFVLTSLYLLLCTSIGTASISSLLRASSNGTGNTYESRREIVLFQKYWSYTFATLLLAAYTTAWSLATIFDDGRFTGDFLTRWNLGVVAINYNPCEGVKLELWLSFGWLLFYLSTITIFYIWDLLPAVRGTSELLGILLLRPLMLERTLAKYYTAVGIFGFIFHLYTVYSARAITLFVILYCKFLENLARRWNLRFCYVCGMLGRFELPNKYITYLTVIPYTKLFTEHKLILSFSRHTSQIFSIALTAYFFQKFLEMILWSYVTCCLFMFEDVDSFERNGTLKTLLCPPGYPYHCHTIKYRDENVYFYMSLFYCTCQSIFGWYITTESISNCGHAIMSGFHFVRRYGFPRCKNSKERRFIQSLNFAFSPISDYCVSPGYLVINRKFIYEMFALVFVFTSMLVSFSPYQLGNREISFCFSPIRGIVPCYAVDVPKHQTYNVITEYEDKYAEVKAYLGRPDFSSRTEAPPTVATPPPIPPPAKYTICQRQTDYATVAVGTTVAYPNGIAVPRACESPNNGLPIKPFPTRNPNDKTGFCFADIGAHKQYSMPYEAIPPKVLPDLYYCGTNVIIDPTIGRDDCGNIPFSADGSEPPKKAVLMWLSQGKPPNLIVYDANCCCYDYEFYRQPELNIRVEQNACAMNSIVEASKFCANQCSQGKTC